MVKYKTHRLTVGAETNPEAALKEIRSLKDAVTVNIVFGDDEETLFFSMENLVTSLSNGSDSLKLQTLHVKEYGSLMQTEIQLVEASSKELKSLLRDQFVEDMEATVKRLLEQVQNLCLLSGCYMLQRPQSAVVEQITKLKGSHQKLDAACFKWRDNVRLMDELQYGVMPTLSALSEEMRLV